MLLAGRYFIPESEFEWEFVQSAGPDGQNVNKVATAVRLRFPLETTPFLPPEVRERLLTALAGKLSGGFLVVTAREERAQGVNRRRAVEKLSALLEGALKVPKLRKPTRPTAGSVRRRLAAKERRSMLKRSRSYRPGEEE